MKESTQPVKCLFAAMCFCLAAVCLHAQLPAVLPPLDSLPEAEVRGYVAQMEAAALALQETRAAAWDNATAARGRAEGAYKIAKQDTTTDKNTLKTLEKAFKTAQSAEKDAEKKRKQAQKIYDATAQLASADIGAQRKNTPKIWAQLQKANETKAPPSEPTSPAAQPPKPKRNKKEKPVEPEKPIAEIISASETAPPATPAKPPSKPPKVKKTKARPDTSGVDEPVAETDTTKNKKTRLKKTKKIQRDTTGTMQDSDAPLADGQDRPRKPKTKTRNPKPTNNPEAPVDSTDAASRPSGVAGRATPLARYKVYNPAEDVLLAPPVPPCVLAIDTRDEFSGEIQRETARAELFRHTNPALKNYIKGKSHVVCEAAIGHAGAQAYLYLTFTVNDPNAPRTLGSLPKSGLAIVKLLDGGILNLYNIRADDGVAGPDGQYWTFRGQYALDKAALRSIRSEELDKIRLAWANGYEDYEVHNVRLLMRLAKCVAAGMN